MEGIFAARSPYFCVAIARLRRRRGSGYGRRWYQSCNRPAQRGYPGGWTERWNCVSAARCRKMSKLKKRRASMSLPIRGKVLLVGQSPNSELSARAKQIAMGVEGTTEVYNEIRQGQPIGLGTASNDTWITTKVRSQLLTSDQVKSSNVKVTDRKW
ncbi:lipoprotein [Salmonella bongori]|nr:lipoprotein [Salmonella bongori]